MDLITSRTNPTLRLVRSLYGRRSARRREGLFAAEGQRTVQTLVDQGCTLTHLLIDASRANDVSTELTVAAQTADARVLHVDTELFLEMSDVETPQSLIGIFEVPTPDVPESPRVVVALDGIQDPGNLGSILRTCRAAGVDLVLLPKGVVDPYSPKVIRATAGQFTSLPLVALTSPSEMAEIAPDLQERVVIADSNLGVAHTRFDWTEPFVLVLGSEGAGPGEEWKALATDYVHIRMSHDVESLNVGAAAAVLLFEAQRQIHPG